MNWLSIQAFKARFKNLDGPIDICFLGFGFEVGYLFLCSFSGLRKFFAGRLKFFSR